MHYLQEKARRMFDLERDIGHSATVSTKDPDFREIKSLGLMDAAKWTGVSCLHGRGCLAGDGKHSRDQLLGLDTTGKSAFGAYRVTRMSACAVMVQRS